jgi:hypothetical protein
LSEHLRAALARQTHRRQRVRGLARLGDADHEVALVDDRVAVAELRGDVELHGDARPLLDRVAADKACVVRGAARNHRDPADVAQVVVADADVPELHLVARHAVEDRLGDRIRLLVDLLEHVGLVAALLGRGVVPVDRGDLALERRAGRLEEASAIRPQHHDLVVVQELDVARLGQEGRDRGSDEGLARGDAHDEGALFAGAHEHLGLVGAHRYERVVAAQLGVGAADRLHEVALVVACDQVGHHLGIGL